MGGSKMSANQMIDLDDDWELASSFNVMSTMVLVGKTGNGKSATGNSILGRKAFISKSSSAGVTSTCKMQSTILKDGRTVNVIDTPGVFDLSSESEYVGKEIVRCMDLAKDGIHAVLVVFSVRSRFSKEEQAAIQSLQTLFGEKITDHMIVVFTGGDDLEYDGETLEDYIGHNCPEALKKFLRLCKNRVVLFDNKTKDEVKRVGQVRQLISLVDSVVAANNGQPFSDEFLVELKEGTIRKNDEEKEVESLKGYTEQQISDLKNQINKSHDDQLARITAMVEQKLKLGIERLEKQLADEQAAREQAVKNAQEAQMRSEKEIRVLRESLEKAQKENERARKENDEFRKRAENAKCLIL